MRKTPIIVILTLLLTLLFVSCDDTAPSGTQNKDDDISVEVVTVTIPDVTVDLRDPENKVDVSETEPSELTDSTGRKLTKDEWLLNSKFSKEYILSLGVGEYTFEYKSESKKGTLKLIITDSEIPNYVFTSEIPAVIDFYGSAVLPTLVKEQDSYQGDYEVSYLLKRSEDTVEFDISDGAMSADSLTEGSYKWIASLEREGTVYTYEQSFYVQSFEEYYEDNAAFLMYDEPRGEYAALSDGYYHINNIGSPYTEYKYTLEQEIIDKAVAAGKTKLTFTVVSKENAYNGLWMTDSWNNFKIGFSSSEAKTDDRLSWDSQPCYTATEITVDPETGDMIYTYTGVTLLTKGYFTKATPLQLWIANGVSLDADVKVTFD